jgi:hypothetical protein
MHLIYMMIERPDEHPGFKKGTKKIGCVNRRMLVDALLYA